MTESKIPEDWMRKNGYKLKILYSYAVVHKLNIKSETDVLEILKVTDPDNANEDSVKLFSKMLQLFAWRFRETIEKKLT